MFQPHHQWFVLLFTLVSMLLYHELLMFFLNSHFLVDVLQNQSEDNLLLLLFGPVLKYIRPVTPDWEGHIWCNIGFRLVDYYGRQI